MFSLEAIFKCLLTAKYHNISLVHPRVQEAKNEIFRQSRFSKGRPRELGQAVFLANGALPGHSNILPRRIFTLKFKVSSDRTYAGRSLNLSALEGEHRNPIWRNPNLCFRGEVSKSYWTFDSIHFSCGVWVYLRVYLKLTQRHTKHQSFLQWGARSLWEDVVDIYLERYWDCVHLLG